MGQTPIFSEFQANLHDGVAKSRGVLGCGGILKAYPRIGRRTERATGQSLQTLESRARFAKGFFPMRLWHDRVLEGLGLRELAAHKRHATPEP